MIHINITKTFNCTVAELFSLIDSIDRLAQVKKSLSRFTVARSEPGLQIADAVIPNLVMNMNARLKYSTRPDNYAELKQISGDFREYLCTYTIREAGVDTVLDIELRVKFRLGPIGFLRSLPLKPLYRLRIHSELRRLERQVRRMKTV